MINSTQKVNLCIFSSDIVDMKQRQKCLDLARNAGSYFSFVGMSMLPVGLQHFLEDVNRR